MATLHATDVQDVVNSTLNELGRLKMTDVSSDYRNTIALKRLMNKNKVTYQGGSEIEFMLLTDTNNSFRFLGIGENDIVNIPNVTTRGKIPWRHCTFNWGMDGRLISMNSGNAYKLMDIVQEQRIAALGSAVIGMERAFWRKPAESNTTNPYGVEYWIVKNNTTGFNGGVPVGWSGSTVANVSPTTYARWKNYTAQYTAVSKDDLIRKMRKAMFETDFKNLVEETPTYNTGDDYQIYTNYTVLATFEELLEAQNENLGSDLASMDGKTMFRKIPVVAVQELENDTTNPVYGINWGEFKTVVLKGWWMKEFMQDHVPGQHTMQAWHCDTTFNYICRNRRRNWVIATNTTDIAA